MAPPCWLTTVAVIAAVVKSRRSANGGGRQDATWGCPLFGLLSPLLSERPVVSALPPGQEPAMASGLLFANGLRWGNEAERGSATIARRVTVTKVHPAASAILAKSQVIAVSVLGLFP